MRSLNMELSEDEKNLLNTPFKALSPEDRATAFSLSDRIADWNRAQSSNPPTKITIIDRDRLLADGVLSPLDQKTAFHNRRDWAEHLKAHGCVEIGNDFNKSTEKPREIKGDFDCRAELSQATHQIMEKYGY